MSKKVTVLVVMLSFFCLLISTMAFAKDKVIHWKVQGCVPNGMLFHETLERLAKTVNDATDGRLVWEVFPSGTFVPGFEGLKAVSDGIYQVNYGYPGQWVGKIQTAAIMNSVPGGFNSYGMQMWHEYGGGKELYQEMYDQAKYNVKVFREASCSMENFQWAKKPLKTIADFKGVKMRMMPLMGDVLSKHGFSVAFVPASEIIPDLQRGVLDAAEYSISAFDITLGIDEVCNYVMLPGIHQPTGSLEVLINKDAWNALPEDLKKSVEIAINKSRFDNMMFMEARNIAAVQEIEKEGVHRINMDPDTVKQMIKWSDEYLDEVAKKDPFFAKVRASQKAFAAKWYPYIKEHTLNH